jgi:hypothetical protein
MFMCIGLYQEHENGCSRRVNSGMVGTLCAVSGAGLAEGKFAPLRN